MAISATINDVARDGRSGSLRIAWRLNGRSTCDIEFLAPASAPLVGQRLGVFDGAVRIFGGSLDEVTKVLFDGSTILYRCRATSWEQRLDFRLIVPALTTAYASSTYVAMSGTVDTVGTAVTLVSGDEFDKNLQGTSITINAVAYTVASVASTTSLTLTATAGTQSGVAYSFAPTCGNVFRSLLTNFAVGELAAFGTIEAGPTLDKVSWDHAQVSTALTELAERAAKIWYVDPDLSPFFTDRATVAAPTQLTTANALRDGYEDSVTREDVVNNHFRRINWNSFPVDVATFVGTGSRKTFWVPKPTANVEGMTLEIPGSVREATFGIRGQDTGKDFYWSVGERKITQDASLSVGVTAATNASPIVITTAAAHGLVDGHGVTISGVLGNDAANGFWRVDVLSATTFELIGATGNGAYTSGGTVVANAAPATTDVLTVLYRRHGGDVIAYADDAAIAARNAIEDGSGRYEKIEEAQDRVGQVESLAYSTAIVAAFKNDARVLTITTDVSGYKVGHLVTVQNSTFGITDGLYLLDEMSAVDMDGAFVRYTLRLLDGSRLGGWVEYFKEIAAKRAATQLTGSGGSVSGGGGGGGGGAAVDGYHENAGAATVTPDLANGINHEVLLDRASTTIADAIFTGGTLAAGQRLVLILRQDATGGRFAVLNSNYVVGVGFAVMGSASTQTIINFVRQATGKWLCRSWDTGLPA